MDRRTLLGACGAALLAPAAPKSRVVIAHRGEAAKLVDRAVQAFFATDGVAEAWRRLVRPGEVIGLKVNCLAGRGNSTSVPLVNAVAERVLQAGAREVLIFDRLNADLESAGYRIAERGRVRRQGNDTLGYEDELAVHGQAGSLLARALTRVCDGILNLPVLKDHGIVGVTLALKNLFGAIHNPNKYHVAAGDPYVADVYMLGPIRQKVRLAICDGLTAQYEGGPPFMPQWTWPYNGLLVARDPVALDYTGWQIIERKRAEMGFKPLKAVQRHPAYIATAAAHGIGTDDPLRIERVEV